MILGIAISVVFPTISAQKIFYEKIKQRELAQLYAENIFWENLYNLGYSASNLTLLSYDILEENFVVYSNGKKDQIPRKIMNLRFLFNNKEYDVDIIYDTRK
ncbi:MAG: hypothetical protein PWP54_993 [Thermosipho sp. (in: thermotogales)]|nr:hypothetical protein [Thermosipho sp. (in: thermotogales)]